MPRRSRREEAGAVHHVYAHAVADRPLFRDDLDRRFYVDLLAWVVNGCGWHCLAYCLMDTHMHLLIETPEPNLGKGMQRLHGDYAALHNKRHRLRGHVFERRFQSKRIKDDAQLLTVAAYIANNPVKAHACSVPSMWPWSSHRSVIDGDAPPWLAAARLLEYFAAWGGDGRTRYAAFVAERNEAPP